MRVFPPCRTGAAEAVQREIKAREGVRAQARPAIRPAGASRPKGHNGLLSAAHAVAVADLINLEEFP